MHAPTFQKRQQAELLRERFVVNNDAAMLNQKQQRLLHAAKLRLKAIYDYSGMDQM
jgi:hypothetical protein